MSPEQTRLPLALLLSLLVHTLLLSLTFGGQGLWLPGLGFPWRERRIEAPDLRVVLVAPNGAVAQPSAVPVADPLEQAWVEQRVRGGRVGSPSASRGPTPQPSAAAIMPQANLGTEATQRTGAAPDAAPLAVGEGRLVRSSTMRLMSWSRSFLQISSASCVSITIRSSIPFPRPK